MERGTLLRSHAYDPPADTERWRKFVIEGLSGTANSYIRCRALGATTQE